MKSPTKIIDEMMISDAMSQWLGIDVIEISLASVVIRMKVRDEMVNGFGVAHGGITYSLADSCLAFAINAHGRKAMSVETSISHLKRVKAGDVLTANSTELSLTHKIGVYSIDIGNQDEELVAHFKGTCYRSVSEW